MPTDLYVLQAEVQSFYADGAIALHTRSLKYGKVSLQPDTQTHSNIDPSLPNNL